MPKGRTPQDILDEISWLRNLEETSWSQGILDTADDLTREVGELEEQQKQLVADLKQKRSKRLKVLRSIPGRAAREVEFIYTEEQIATAKNGAASEETSPE